ncbi:hypothetical protein BURK_004252 [Burkholderia sp. SJ98]|nr:hypothetical protein BURK_004252 [Burkholderia sp. SJ98]
MRTEIPSPVISVVAAVLERRYTHATMNSLFLYANAPGEAPEGNKLSKATEWLRRVNKVTEEPLCVLGKLIEESMEALSTPDDWDHAQKEAERTRLQDILVKHNLQYIRGGNVVGALGVPSRTLESMLKEFDFAAVDHEFDRALGNVESEPREAVSAASNILESLCKAYIAEAKLVLPQRQDLKPLWELVRRDLGFDPGAIADRDLQTILTGLFAVVEGIGALRTHASSAHGSGTVQYRLEGRHARLAIHSAHTIAIFLLETWQKKREARPSS